ncbi:sugar phosphate nucleotidyltransferase [Halonotius roseus]|uniref:Bifunctional protein GlmU n=1 Tax=Halonotius roseus TaxID=2511997 RepID=A0A544QMY5_9EURY|nr:sugar phosphate nucleotidyltransferase [Halonotius roseus]TQQ80287.1 glucose-1-phosphate thymidylyltransferase [Halonotius roseus]
MSQSTPTAVILAAGEGQRLSPLTNRRPKPMLPVVNKPLLEHVLEAVIDAGIEEIVFVVGYERDRIQTYFGNGDDWDVSIEYAVQENQLGTAHAVQQAESHVDGDFLVLNGDRIIGSDAVADVHAAMDGETDAAMAVTRVPESEAYGVVTLSGDEIVDIIEKPRDELASNIINAGVYGFTPAVFDVIDATPAGPDGEYRLTDVLARVAENGTIRPVRYNGRWLDVSYPWDLLSVTGQLLDQDGGDTAGSVGAGAQIDTAAHLASTAAVGANTVVGRGSTVAANARIGPNATITRSVIFPDATVEAGAVLSDCIVGANATVGANVTAAGGEATVVTDGEIHSDVIFGGLIGDNAAVGGAATIAPGGILGNDVVVGEGAVASGTIPDGVEIRRG